MSNPQGKGFINVPANITGIASIPMWTVESGTYTCDSTTKTVLISDGGISPTCNFSNILIGDWLESNGEIRQVRANYSIGNNQRIDINKAFSSDPSGQAVHHIKNKIYTRIILENTGGANGTINGQVFAHNGYPIVLENAAGLDPIIVNGTGTTLQVVEMI
jgi:hypothetical protein